MIIVDLADALAEFSYVHLAGKRSVAFTVSVKAGTIYLSRKELFIEAKSEIPIPAIVSLAWGRANLLYVNWQDGAAFRQSEIIARPADLENLVGFIRGIRPELIVDEGNKSITENKLAGLIAVAMLVMAIPVAFFYLAIYFGYIPAP